MLSEGCRNPSPRGAPAPHSTNCRVRSHAIASPHTQPGNSRLRCSLGRLAAPQSPGNGPPSVSIPRGGMPMTELRNRQYRHIEVHPIAGSLGAEIDGVDLSQELDDEVLGEIRSALLDNLVIFARNQDLTPERQLVFAKRWGDIHLHPFMQGMDDYPEVLEIKKLPSDKKNFGGSWHSDQQLSQKPAMGTILYEIGRAHV